MFQEEDYDSDTSDEDFIPEGTDINHDDVDSENDDFEDLNEEDESQSVRVKKKKEVKKKKNPLLAELDEPKETQLFKPEKEEVNKTKEEDLWADFLADVDEPPPKPKAKSSSWASVLGNKKSSSSNSVVGTATTPPIVPAKMQAKVFDIPAKQNKVKITKVFEFAGEEVRVEKEVDANSAEAEGSDSSSDQVKDISKGTKRPGGFSNVLGLLDKKKQKLTTLEKTKLDWNNFKVLEGIDEELESHKKSKDGYLEKQEFLERADLRQFEIERAMRMNKRSNR